MNMQTTTGGVCAAKGFKAGGVHCGIKKGSRKEKPDLAMILSDEECAAAAVYTQNKVQGAPIAVTKQHLAGGKAWGILCNSGNANTCNPNGAQVALQCCEMAAEATGRKAEDFVLASTGVIGQPLELAPFQAGIPAVAAALSAGAAGSAAAAHAIMTTDPAPKETAVQFTIGGKPCHIGAICKGSGMININMATMLCFITTDVAITPDLLADALKSQVAETLNQVSVDGDTSTNDMACILANGLAGNRPIADKDGEYGDFCAALQTVLVQMAREIAAGGEGATKLLACKVQNAPSAALARAIAKTVISSDLFKAAMFGQDANWGRVLCAIGYTPGDFSVEHVSLTLKSNAGEVLVCKDSAYHPYSEEAAAKVLAEGEIEVLIDMGAGSSHGEAWGCDLTYDYVKINGDYRT